MGFVFLVLFVFIGLTTLSGQEVEMRKCHSDITNNRDVGIIYLINDTVPVHMQDIRMELSTTSEYDVCIIDMEDYALQYPILDMALSRVVLFKFICKGNIDIFFHNIEDAKTLLQNSSIIGYLQIEGCGIFVSNIRHVIDITIMPSVVVMHAKYRTGDKFPQQRLYQLENSSSTCTGFNRIRAFVLWNTTAAKDFLTELHTCQEIYPEMAEIIFWNLSLEILPMDLTKVYPNLQSCDIKQNMFTTIPHFPWTCDEEILPSDLFRSETFQKQYAGAYNLDIPRNIFRRIYDLSSNNISYISEYAFAGYIHSINLRSNNIHHISETAVWRVTGLQDFSLKNNEISNLPQKLLANQTELTFLDLSSNQIKTIDKEFFKYSKKLEYIDLSSNHLNNLPDGAFISLTKLKTLNIDRNELKSFQENLLPQNESEIQTLSLQYNKLNTIPTIIFYKSSLKNIYLAYNNISIGDLTLLVSKINLQKFKFMVAQSRVGTFEINIRVLDLHNNSVNSLFISNTSCSCTKDFVRTLLRYYEIRFTNNSFTCNCKIYSLIELLRGFVKEGYFTEQNHFIRNLKCEAPEELRGELVLGLSSKPDRLYCEKNLTFCPRQCKCFERLKSKIIIIECSYRNLSNMPSDLPDRELEIRFSNNKLTKLEYFEYYRNVVELHLQYNNLKIIDKRVLESMKKLKVLSLEYNLLTYLPSALKHSTSLNSITISHNPFRCDCHTKWMKTWLVDRKDIIKDWDEVSCSTENRHGRLFITVTEREFFCQSSAKVYIDKKIWIYILFPCICVLIFCLILVFRKPLRILFYFYFGIRFCKTNPNFAKKIDILLLYPETLRDWIEPEVIPIINLYGPKRVVDIYKDVIAGHKYVENVRYFIENTKTTIYFATDNLHDTPEDSYTAATSIVYEILEKEPAKELVIVWKNPGCKAADKNLRKVLKKGKCINSESKMFKQKLVYELSLNEIRRRKDDIPGESYIFPYENPVFTIEDSIEQYSTVFIAYSECDRPWVLQEIFPIFKLINVNFISEEDFNPGQTILDNIHNAIRTSDLTFLILSNSSVNDPQIVHVFDVAYDKSLNSQCNHLLVGYGDLDIRNTIVENECMRSYLQSYVPISIHITADQTPTVQTINRALQIRTLKNNADIQLLFDK